MKTFLSTIQKIIIITILAVNGWGTIQPFTKINPSNTYNIQGNYAIAGNTVMCLTEKTSGYGGTCQDTGYEYITSNMHVSKYIDIDDDNRTWNSTSSYITFPTSFDETSTGGKGVLWAGLFWQGRISYDKNYVMHYGIENSSTYTFIETGQNSTETLPSDLNATEANKIKLKIDNHPYSNITSTTFYEYSSSNGITYAAFADVTSIVNTNIQTAGKHVFTIANLTTNEGRESSPGVFGGWSLVVIYAENSSGKMRNISVYSGFDKVADPSDAFTITNFILPKSNNVNASLALFSGEGEYLYGRNPKNSWAYDWIKISPDGINYDYMPGATHENNIFDAVFTGITRDDINGSSNNLQINNDGVDVDTFDVSNLMTQYRDNNPNLNTMYIQWASNNDYITPSMITFATELYAPKFCYDYAYKQEDVYFTEENDGSRMPYLSGTVFPNKPIEMTLFIRNLVDSDIQVTDMNVSILDINTSQTTYIRNSTKIAKTIDIFPKSVLDSSLNVSDSFVKNINIGTVDANDYFYIYYNLNPLISDINDTINVQANYNLTLNGVTVPYQLRLGEDMEICSNSNFKYAPAKGIFNIVHNNYYDYDSGGLKRYYNLPTQITERVGNFKVLSMDPDNLDNLKKTSTIVAVEMIDAAAFHDTNASCMEMSSSISPRVWVLFDNNTTSTQFNNSVVSPNFYSNARKNTAFRVSFNVMDENGSTPLIQKENDGTYTIINWRTAWNGESCKQDMDGNPNNSDSVASYCNDTGNNPNSLAKCMECVYGKDIRMVCSRDNFAIRPEAFMLNLNDQNQSSISTAKIKLTPNYSGIVGAIAPVLNLAANYNYYLEVNATNHIDNNISNGYTRLLDSNLVPNDLSEYIWEPRTATVSNACNDESNKTVSLYFLNGNSHKNTKVNQVGEYRLHFLDKTWTAVDSNTSFMTHHTGSFFQAGYDCIQNSAVTQLINSPSLNGCDISSNHINPSTGVKYNDLNVTFHPYTFNIVNIVKLGRANILPMQPTNANYFKPFVYMANLSDDENMSVHLNTTIFAVGKDSNITLSNYVNGCFAKPLNITIGKTATTNATLVYNYNVHNKDKNGTIIHTNDINKTIPAGNLTTNPTFTTTTAYFHKDMNGTTQITTNLNFKREVNATTNPEDINFTTLIADDNATLFTADLNTSNYAKGTVDVNQRVLYYYGRTIAPEIRVICKSNTCRTGISATNNNNIRELITYVIYCDPTTTICSANLNLPSGSQQIADIRWWENRNHDKLYTTGTDGTIGTITEVVNSGNVQEVNRTIYNPNYTTESIIEYSGPLPYDAVMQMQSSPWLINNPNDANATKNKFIIHFTGDGGWSGKYEDNTTTKTNASTQTNRRIMW